MDIVDIRYKNSDHLCGNWPIKMQKHCEIEWNLDENTIKSLRHYKTMQVLYSSPFGNNI